MTFMSRTFDNMVIRMAQNNQFTGQNQTTLRRARATLRARTRALRAQPKGVTAK
jgi:hypothetical protein